MEHKQAAKFVGLLFLSRDTTHKMHLASKSYSEHKALESFYEGIGGYIDSFAEMYQGCYETLLDIPIVPQKDISDPVKYLKEVLKWVKNSRYDICPSEETSLQNLIDEIMGLYYSTIYKLTFLK
jgi:hypothetical protein